MGLCEEFMEQKILVDNTIFGFLMFRKPYCQFVIINSILNTVKCDFFGLGIQIWFYLGKISQEYSNFYLFYYF
jgi:hypothetical protein